MHKPYCAKLQEMDASDGRGAHLRDQHFSAAQALLCKSTMKRATNFQTSDGRSDLLLAKRSSSAQRIRSAMPRATSCLHGACCQCSLTDDLNDVDLTAADSAFGVR